MHSGKVERACIFDDIQNHSVDPGTTLPLDFLIYKLINVFFLI